LGFGLIIPALPFYAESFGASFITVGLLSMSYSLMQFVFAPLWGRLSDRVGRRPIILLSLSGSCIAFLIFGFASSLVWLFIGRTLAGILSSASIPTAQAFVADSTTPQQRAKGMGIIGAAFGLGFIFGPAAGGILTKFGYGAPAFAAAGLAGVNFIWAFFKLPESLKEKHAAHSTSVYSLKTVLEIFSDKKLALLFTIVFLNVFAFSNMESTFALFCEHRIGLDAIHVGFLFTEIGVLGAIIHGLLIGKLTQAFGEINLTITGLALMMLGLFATIFAHTTLHMVLFVVPLYAVGSSVCGPAVMALISHCAPPHRQGTTLGFAQSLGAFGRVIGPPSGTGLFQAFSPAAPYWMGAVLLLGSVLLAVTQMKKVLHLHVKHVKSTPTAPPLEGSDPIADT
jgi:multidrug resistance protein